MQSISQPIDLLSIEVASLFTLLELLPEKLLPLLNWQLNHLHGLHPDFSNFMVYFRIWFYWHCAH